MVEITIYDIEDIIICSKCGGLFDESKVVTKTEGHKEKYGYEEKFFNCPICKNKEQVFS